MFPILFSVGHINFYTSSIIFAIGFIISLFLFWKKTRIEIIEEEKIFDFILVFIVSGLIMGRIVYVFEHIGDFSFWLDRAIHVYKYPGFNIWGICFGGVLGAFLFIKKKLKSSSAPYLLDALSLSLSLFLAFVFLGFFFDGVYVGGSSEFFGINFIGFAGKRLPIQLIGVISCSVFFIFTNKMNLKKTHGIIFWLFCSFFFALLLALEFFRGDRIYFEGIVFNKFSYFLVSLFSVVIFIIKYKNQTEIFLKTKILKFKK